MELKRTTEILNLINDINQKSIRELGDQYLSSEEAYHEFLESYGTYFLGENLHSVRMADQFEKIQDLLDYGSIMYPSEDYDKYEEAMNNLIDFINRKYDVHVKVDDKGFSDYTLIDDNMGASKCKGSFRYEKVIEGIKNAVEIYNEKGKNRINNFREYIDLIDCNFDQIEFEKALKKYYEDHPLIRECKDVYFLFFANYLLTNKKSLVDQEFIDDVKDVIDVSMFLFGAQLEPKEDIKSYKRLAKYTLKNIKKYEESKNKKEDEKEKRGKLKELFRRQKKQK